MKLDEAQLYQIHEMFKLALTEAINSCRVYTATVVNVDDTHATVKVSSEESLRVPLKLYGLEASCIKVVPKIDTMVVVCNLDRDVNRPYFIAFEQIDKVEFVKGNTSCSLTLDPDDDSKDEFTATVGGSEVHVTSDEITFNGGDNGGLVKVKELTDKLNAIEDDINNLKQSIIAAPNVPNDGGAAFKAALTPWTEKRLKRTNKSDYENDKIKQ